MKKIDKEAFARLSAQRERRRLKRLKNKSKSKASHNNSKNNFRTERINIIIPATLDLEDNRDKLIELINRIQDVLLNGKSFVIDHRKMENITKEALLLLTAEIERCTTIMGIKLKAKSKFLPKNSYIKSLLKKIGYWDYFNLNAEEYCIGEGNGSELYLKIVGDTQVSGEKIGSLIQFFEKLICFDAPTKDKFSDAMIEAAANTVEHAYSVDQDTQNIKKWWLTASINKATNEISFIFYDQGLGVLNTLEATQKNIKYKRLVAGWFSDGVSKGGVLKKLVNTNLSSYKDERRGNGLISFKTFIDNVQGGELTIYTDDVSYSAVADKIENYRRPIRGTLIVWKIEANQIDDKCIYIKGH
ncbi:MAG: hypothetical protein RLZ75_2454 [Pseudomonadota bacterium]|jgi:anti-sigma regulatory factor (Ser/Thr protein kinase)